MRRHSVVGGRGAAAAFVCALLLTACSSDGGAPSSAPSATDDNGGAASTEPIRVGVSLSFSGNFSDNGEAARRGFELWARHVNDAGGLLGGRPVEMVFADDASSTQQVVTNYENFIQRDGVDLVLGPFSSLLTLPASEVAERLGYAFIEGMANSPEIFEACRETLVFVGPADSVESASVWADYILSLPEEDRPTTAAYAAVDNPFAAPAADALQATFEENGIETVYDEVYSSDSADLLPVVQGIAAEQPEMVVSGTLSIDAFAQVQAMIQQDFNPEFLFMTSGAAEIVDFPANVGAENTTGVFTTDSWSPRLDTSGNADFVAGHQEEYGGSPSSMDNQTAQAYASGQLTAQVLEEAGSIDQQAIVDVARGGTWQTVLGEIAPGECGEPTGVQLLLQWQNGERLVVYPPELAETDPLPAPKAPWGTPVEGEATS